MMNVYEWEKNLLDIAKRFVDGKLTALEFYHDYEKAKKTKFIPDENFKTYKDGMIHDIYATLEMYCEPELRQPGDEEGIYYNDDQLKQAIQIFLSCDTEDERYEKLKEAGLTDTYHPG